MGSPIPPDVVTAADASSLRLEICVATCLQSTLRASALETTLTSSYGAPHSSWKVWKGGLEPTTTGRSPACGASPRTTYYYSKAKECEGPSLREEAPRHHHIRLALPSSFTARLTGAEPIVQGGTNTSISICTRIDARLGKWKDFSRPGHTSRQSRRT